MTQDLSTQAVRKTALPCVYDHLHHTLMKARAKRRSEVHRKLLGSPEDLAIVLIDSVKDSATLHWFVQWCRPKNKQVVEWTLETREFNGLDRKMALEVATEFFDFAAAHHLTSTLQGCDAQHMMTLAVHHAHCLVTSPKPIGVTVNSQYILRRGIYVP